MFMFAVCASLVPRPLLSRERRGGAAERQQYRTALRRGPSEECPTGSGPARFGIGIGNNAAGTSTQHRDPVFKIYDELFSSRASARAARALTAREKEKSG